MRFQLSTFAKVLAVAAFVLAFNLAAQAADTPDGSALFKQKCAMCHGAEGKGYSAMKTPDFTDPKVQASISDKEMTETIKNGKSGTAMPAFAGKLSDDEIQAVVKFIRSLKK